MSRKTDFDAWVERNYEDLMASWAHYSSQPHIDYCHGEGGCGHAHSFQAFCRREWEARESYLAMQDEEAV